MGGPKINDSAKEFIISVWLNSIERGDKPVAQDMLDQLHEKCAVESGNGMIEAMPKLRWVQLVIEKAQKNLANETEDIEWSFGSLNQFPIPPYALPLVLHVWEIEMKLDRRMTIRQVKWATQLSSVVTNRFQLHKWAKNFASQELICIASGKPFDATKFIHILIFDMKFSD